MSDQPILFVHHPATGRALVERLRGHKPLFACVIGHTDICELPGVSAAGASAELRRYTAAADVEMLRYGRPRCLPSVPLNPLGPPSPVVITAAALRLAGIAHVVVDAGTRVKPDVPCEWSGEQPGLDIRTGRAVANAARLFEKGLELGGGLAERADYLLIGESVPGGTTTALTLMLALGIAADGKVSSSGADNAHELKSRLARQALAAAWPDGRPEALDPLEAAARIGDPMQPVAAGMALGALSRCPVVLAGGTQMTAVLALMAAYLRSRGERLPTDRLGIATTRWVADDPQADLAGLAAQLGQTPVLAANLDFNLSRHAGLRRYEERLVKEGVGAGGAALAALLAGVSRERLQQEIDLVVDALGLPTAE